MALRSGYKGFKKLGSGLKMSRPGVLEADGEGGTNVVANPEGAATSNLEKLQVGQSIYSIPEADTSECYKKSDSTESAIVDADYIPFLDSSAEEGEGAPKKSTWSNFCSKIAAKFATVFNEYLGISTIGAGLIVNNGVLSATATGVNYSTSEQNTGIKWVDGKDVYSKTVMFPSAIIASAASTWTASGVTDATIENIIDAKLLNDTGSGVLRYYPGIVTVDANNELEFMHFRSASSIGFLGFIIYYTKISS